MYGQGKQTPYLDGFAPQTKNLPGTIPGRILYEPITAHPYIVEGTDGQDASVYTYGRGLMAVSNKPSELNIFNQPVIFVGSQPAMIQYSRYTPRILSRNIPAPSTGG